jgi:hypothetical protein
MRVAGDLKRVLVKRTAKQTRGDLSCLAVFFSAVLGKVASSNNKVSLNLRFIAFD